MLAGLGIDMVEIARVQRELRASGPAPCESVLTAAELGRARASRSTALAVARCFAAKEALFKALGHGWQGGLAWREVELCDGGDGSARLLLSGQVQRAAERLGVRHVSVSVSHTERLAMASVVLEA